MPQHQRIVIEAEIEVTADVDAEQLAVAEIKLYRSDGKPLSGANDDRQLRIVARPFGVGGRLLSTDPRITHSSVWPAMAQR